MQDSWKYWELEVLDNVNEYGYEFVYNQCYVDYARIK